MPSNEALLDHILRQVSRSIYLSLQVLPRRLRRPIGLAYLFCRAADTIADTALIAREQRLTYLDLYREAFSELGPMRVGEVREALTGAQRTSAERKLLWHLEDCFALFAQLRPDDQQRIRRLVFTLTQGMQTDLRTFPGENGGRVAALETRADLDRYTYDVAGCVGEFWTRMAVAHRPTLAHWHLSEMEQKGVRFGKGLQMTNILRDLPHDLRLGRCYLPYEDLRRHGLTPEALLDPGSLDRLRPLLGELLALTLEHYQSG
jgi:farnesyl-diphosphate farnesyltransferase